MLKARSIYDECSLLSATPEVFNIDETIICAMSAIRHLIRCMKSVNLVYSLNIAAQK